jgi:hypothetical protein
MFFQVEAEYKGLSATRFQYAKNKYLEFVVSTNAYYDELVNDPRFYLSKYWDVDALVRFNRWLVTQLLASKTRYGIYKSVRQVMHIAYALRIIDTVVFSAPVFKGVSETKERAAYSKVEQEVINAAVARWIGLGNSIVNGYTPLGTGIPYRMKNTVSTVLIDERLYSVREAEEFFGIKHSIISTRIKKGWTPRQAVGIEEIPKARAPRLEISVDGLTYPSISRAAEAFGLTSTHISGRLLMGYTPEQSVGLEPIHVLQSDERALLWSFENQFGCDALGMCEHFYQHYQPRVCTMQRLSKLFIRWGVWPYIDDRLIMPLAVEFSMLTGLNVESLKLLDIDSYKAEHPLTGQPVLIYLKKRSASTTRTVDRQLHVSLLELEEQYIDQSVVGRLEKLLGLIIGLTSKIRGGAPSNIARRLFIFEDVELSRKLGEKTIVSLDPKKKAGHWYRRFCNEESLNSTFGDSFNFNLARCRPTLATNMVLAGASLFQVQVVLGHESIGTTATYLDEQGLKPIFNRTVTEALERIASRSRAKAVIRPSPVSTTPMQDSITPGFHETLSGCGCKNPYSPSVNVRNATKHVEGTACRYWNMCLRCDSAVVTERSLPKLLLYQRRVADALERKSPSIESRRELYEDTIKLIDGILVAGVVFPADVIDTAKSTASTMDDLLVDHLIYQGF